MIANEIKALVDLIGIENIRAVAVAYCIISLFVIVLVSITIFKIGQRIKRDRR